MIKKVMILFLRDIKVNTRDFLTFYMLLLPIIFAISINVFTPGINDTTVNIALISGENKALETYLKDFAKVSLHKNMDAVEERIGRRDDVFGYVNGDEGYYVLRQGNESDESLDYAKILLVFFQEDVQIEDSTAQLNNFGRKVPPMKKMLVNMAMMFTSIMGGMLIAINIIEEKIDMTVRSIHLTPISKLGYLFGKSMTGAFLALYGSVAIILICGFRWIDWLQMLLIIMSSMIVSILVGFIQGINNETVMDAAGSVKMLFLPMAGAVAVAELVSRQWQWTVYWIPFYWTYRATDEVLSYRGTWGFTLLSVGVILVITGLVYGLLMPKIKKGLI